MNKISMVDFKAAKDAVGIISEVTTSIKKIDFSMLGQCPAKAKKVSDFAAFLGTLADEAEAAVLNAQQQYESRPQHLIRAANSRLFEIPREIELEQKTAQSLAGQHSKKTDELIKQGFLADEVESILPFPENELLTHKDNVVKLEAELKNIEAFLRDQLLCDTNLLKDTRLEAHIQGHNQAG